jgi:hypothetical protein
LIVRCTLALVALYRPGKPDRTINVVMEWLTPAKKKQHHGEQMPILAITTERQCTYVDSYISAVSAHGYDNLGYLGLLLMIQKGWNWKRASMHLQEARSTILA